MSNELSLTNENINPIFEEIRDLINNSRNRVYSTVNTEMLNLYWNIGKIIMEIQQGNERASYGDSVLNKLSQKLTAEFGKGFSKRNLERMRKFYIFFPIATTVSTQLSWSHYLELIKIEDENPTVGILLCTDRNKTVVKYTLPKDNKSVFASEYKLHLPTEKELIEAVEEEKKNLEINENK